MIRTYFQTLLNQTEPETIPLNPSSSAIWKARRNMKSLRQPLLYFVQADDPKTIMILLLPAIIAVYTGWPPVCSSAARYDTRPFSRTLIVTWQHPLRADTKCNSAFLRVLRHFHSTSFLRLLLTAQTHILFPSGEPECAAEVGGRKKQIATANTHSAQLFTDQLN